MYLFLTRPLQFDTPWTLKVELVAGQCDRASLLGRDLNWVPPGCEVSVGLLCDDFLSQKRVKKINRGHWRSSPLLFWLPF